jgi:DNA-directed RNA polymerase specialized sigma24 family protein
MWEKVDDISYDIAKYYLFTAAYHTVIDTFRRNQRLTAFDEAAARDMIGENDYSP